MKNVLLFLLTAFVIAGCERREPEDAATPTPPPSKATPKKEIWKAPDANKHDDKKSPSPLGIKDNALDNKPKK